MSELQKELEERSNNSCELCGSKESLMIYEVPDSPTDVKDTSVLACSTCVNQLTDEDQVEPNHWRCLNDSMWNQTPAVQVIAYRMLNQLKSEGWPADLLEMMYLEEETKTWAEAGIQRGPQIIHRDANGHILSKGDNIVLIKDLDVKGANFVAKRGTAVRNISLVHDNADQIEGRANGQHIVILTQYVKKT
ncbi:PhnA domain-containing protein [Nonlabens marinus]|uniref:Alkylphosphonate utilization operon protein PhnA n=1 Tax=Nonlabens marinus S1-08 TaxID=1454201 RepID=W8VSL1_9FLAO|nr:alkylphosphonate utilization protein [Nonlabens marinus]BAO56295.1 alkylphosphonate utilization operon protein PhnA [Nonlabens marinus S1-08]